MNISVQLLGPGYHTTSPGTVNTRASVHRIASPMASGPMGQWSYGAPHQGDGTLCSMCHMMQAFPFPFPAPYPIPAHDGVTPESLLLPSPLHSRTQELLLPACTQPQGDARLLPSLPCTREGPGPRTARHSYSVDKSPCQSRSLAARLQPISIPIPLPAAPSSHSSPFASCARLTSPLPQLITARLPVALGGHTACQLLPALEKAAREWIHTSAGTWGADRGGQAAGLGGGNQCTVH